MVKVKYTYCVTKEKAWRKFKKNRKREQKRAKGSNLEKLCAAKLAVPEKPSAALKLSKLCIMFCPCRQGDI